MSEAKIDFEKTISRMHCSHDLDNNAFKLVMQVDGNTRTGHWLIDQKQEFDIQSLVEITIKQPISITSTTAITNVYIYLNIGQGEFTAGAIPSMTQNYPGQNLPVNLLQNL